MFGFTRVSGFTMTAQFSSFLAPPMSYKKWKPLVQEHLLVKTARLRGCVGSSVQGWNSRIWDGLEALQHIRKVESDHSKPGGAVS